MLDTSQLTLENFLTHETQFSFNNAMFALFSVVSPFDILQDTNRHMSLCCMSHQIKLEK